MRNKWLVLIIVLIVLGIAGFCKFFPGASASEGEEKVSYTFQIRPILSDKCFKCHGPDANKREAHLRLDIPQGAFAELKDNPGRFALVAGKLDSSELWKRVCSREEDYQMPPPQSHLSLTEEEVKLIGKWIRQGAKYEPHWAFVAPVKAPLPAVKKKEWVKNEIDYFVLHDMERKGLEPNEEAQNGQLLKRISMDLTALPPTEKEQDDFLQNKAANAYEKEVDMLLAKPQYGEKMAVYWLDLARYADSYGYQDDNIRTQWPWRDWVIHAFNENMPYNQFITWQLAGDLLPKASKEQILATAFNRNHKFTEEGGVIPEEYRVEYVIDRTNTFGRGVLGMSVECAKCHDHKYDPISQREYYQLFAFFNNTYEKGYEGDVTQSKPAKPPILVLNDTDIRETLQFIRKTDTGKLMVSVMGERDTLRPTYILRRGNYDQHLDSVLASTPKSILAFDTTKYPRNRLGLAEWLVDRKNPLAARVFVNQIWQEFFGRGLVKTPGDFGMQGELPTHPELLDWLAVDFMENGWNIKRLVKQILMSATYRQSAAANSEKREKDPDNIYLSYAPRLRMKAEFVRDWVLSSSGLLVPTIGGSSVKPYQPKGLWELASSGRGELAKFKQDHGDKLYRRGLYTFIKLTVPPPSMIIFDASNRDECWVKRSRTNTPLQALVMLNDPVVLEASRVLAADLMKDQKETSGIIKHAFKKILCREPTDQEVSQLNSLYQGQKANFQNNPAAAAQFLSVGEYPLPLGVDKIELAANTEIIHTLYNLDETIVKN